MKRYIFIVMALLTTAFCSAQMFISQAEYFWNTDPGEGNGTAISAVDGNFNSAFEQFSKTGIATPGSGLHKFCVRIKDSNGVWGPVFTNVIQIESAVNNTLLTIAQAEYFWDTDPGEGNGIPVLAADGNFNSAFEQLTKTGVALPTNGLHVLHVRIKDSNGVWGPVFRNVIEISMPLGNDDFALKNLVVYPNPVKDVLYVSFTDKVTSMSVYNLLGQHVMTKEIHNTEGNIDVSKLNSGTYFVKVQADNKLKTIKIIKE